MSPARYAFPVLLLLATAAIAQTPSLHVTIAAPDHLDGSFNATVEYAVENTGNADLNDVHLEIRESNQSSILSWSAPDWSCTPGGSVLHCTATSLATGATAHIGVVHHFLKPYVRTFISAFATIGTGTDGALTTLDARFFHDFPVTTASVSGPGSLRQAIDEVNARCLIPDGSNPADPCRIAFTIGGPPPAGGWFTIEPESPLPEIVATDLTVDGETQTAIADSNPLGPEVFLLGDRGGVIDGLRFRVPRLLLRGLAIGGFAQNGVLVQGGGSIRNNYLGLDPTGRVAVPNGLRGLMSATGLEVTGNVISGNVRSGIFLVSGDGAVISGNRIGVAAASDDPLPNGASGIFAGSGTNFLIEAKIFDNIIANSGDFGIALAQGTLATIQRNTIFNSGHGGIDLGLDGPTSAGTPLITAVHYDAASNQTMVSGTGVAPVPGSTTIYVYANHSIGADGFAEGEEYLGSVRITGEDSTFALTVPRDLRGLYLDAYSVARIDYGDAAWDTTTEFCRPVRAE